MKVAVSRSDEVICSRNPGTFGYSSEDPVLTCSRTSKHLSRLHDFESLRLLWPSIYSKNEYIYMFTVGVMSNSRQRMLSDSLSLRRELPKRMDGKKTQMFCIASRTCAGLKQLPRCAQGFSSFMPAHRWTKHMMKVCKYSFRC